MFYGFAGLDGRPPRAAAHALAQALRDIRTTVGITIGAMAEHLTAEAGSSITRQEVGDWEAKAIPSATILGIYSGLVPEGPQRLLALRLAVVTPTYKEKTATRLAVIDRLGAKRIPTPAAPAVQALPPPVQAESALKALECAAIIPEATIAHVESVADYQRQFGVMPRDLVATYSEEICWKAFISCFRQLFPADVQDLAISLRRLTPEQRHTIAALILSLTTKV